MQRAARWNTETSVVFPAGETDSQRFSLALGVFGSLIVDPGSELVGKSVNVVAVSRRGNFQPTSMLSEPKVLQAGNNFFTRDELLEIGAAELVFFRLDSAVGSDSRATLLWKA
ncbi:MAG: hypothetical protein KatS3mg109_0047 [Pirellulaceae bacterium]|nr:MAG: hypothetical protein KatS3mg109_0047 [Pirellulaceae bacterium]